MFKKWILAYKAKITLKAVAYVAGPFYLAGMKYLFMVLGNKTDVRDICVFPRQPPHVAPRQRINH